MYPKGILVFPRENVPKGAPGLSGRLSPKGAPGHWHGGGYWVGGGSRPNFEEKSYFGCFCRLSVRALGRPNRLNTIVPRALLIFG